MKKGGNIPIQAFDDYLSFIKKLSNEERVKVERNEVIIKFELMPNLKEQGVKKKSLIDFNDQVDENAIIEKMYTLNSRTEGESFLKSNCNNKSAFERVAKKLDLPFQKTDGIEKLVSKIIERTIGFRLRSQAIQGTNDAINSTEKATKEY